MPERKERSACTSFRFVMTNERGEGGEMAFLVDSLAPLPLPFVESTQCRGIGQLEKHDFIPLCVHKRVHNLYTGTQESTQI